jgi:protein gp37
MRTKIEWCDETWNPSTGCINNCPYCYAKKIGMRFDGYFEPTFHTDRWNKGVEYYIKHKEPLNVFVGSMTDIFQRATYKNPDEPSNFILQESDVIARIMSGCSFVDKKRKEKNLPLHNWIFLTKHILSFDLLYAFRFAGNAYFGLTIDKPYELADQHIGDILNLKGFKFFISFEPVQIKGLSIFSNTMKQLIQYSCCNIIGVETGNRKDKNYPDLDILVQFISETDKLNNKIFLKDSIYKTSIVDRMNSKLQNLRFLPWDVK